MLKRQFDLQHVIFFQEATAVEFGGRMVLLLASEVRTDGHKDTQAGECLVVPFTNAFQLSDWPDIKRPSVEWILVVRVVFDRLFKRRISHLECGCHIKTKGMKRG